MKWVIAAVVALVALCGAAAAGAAGAHHAAARAAAGGDRVRYDCTITDIPADVQPSEAGTYGVISLTVTNTTGRPFTPADYQVYVFTSPGVQAGTAQVPQWWKGALAPGARETFAGGELWPLADTCTLAPAF